MKVGNELLAQLNLTPSLQKHKWGETINRFHPIFYSKDQPTVPSLSPFIRVHLRSSADNNASYPHPPQYDHPQAL